MSIKAALYDLMNNVETDVYPVIAPAEQSDPYAVYNWSRELIRGQDGISTYEVTLTVEIFAKDPSDCLDLAAIIEGNMEAATGTYQSTTILVSNLVSESETEYMGDMDKYGITQTYQLFIDN